MKRSLEVLVLGIASLALSACGGGSDGTNGTNGTNGVNGSSGVSALLSLVAEPAGSNCANGGTKVSAGPDTNGNGTLDASEVTQSRYVCAGAAGATGPSGPSGPTGGTGASGLSALLSLSTEPVGSNCAFGGTRIDTGLDSNGNGSLDSSEVTSTGYVCRSSAELITVAGAAAQLASNTGYIVTTASAQAVLTLPASPALGDTITVTGAGAGGWKIAQNAGQTIRTTGLPGSPALGNWQSLNVPEPVWYAIATTASGKRVYGMGIDFGGSGNVPIYVSNDYGSTWAQSGAMLDAASPNATGQIATSPDGKFVFVSVRQGPLYLSTDSGQTWNRLANAPIGLSWSGLSISSDGSKLVANANQDTHLYVSSDGGASWTTISTAASTDGFIALTASTDGSKVYAAETTGRIWASTNSGANWAVLAGSPSLGWSALASSADGTHLAASMWTSGVIYTSPDSGATWTAQASSSQYWQSLASSSDGSKLLASTQFGGIFQSSDSGITWTAMSTPASWTGHQTYVASSADGKRLYIDAQGGFMAALPDQTSTGTAGSLAGSLGDSVTLQYIGNGQFIVLSYANNSGSFAIQ